MVWTVGTGDRVFARLALAGDLAVLADAGGGLSALSLADGSSA